MLKVLIVDDSMIIRKKISKSVTSLGHNVVGTAQNGAEAIEMYQKLQPDLVTMDITMPDMDGITAVSKIMQSEVDAKIIMVTSHGQEDMVIKSIQEGAVGYILKPITTEKLAQSIGEVFIEYAVDDGDFLDD
ncbi:MAG: response regulator [Campylobacterota bacterium]